MTSEQNQQLQAHVSEVEAGMDNREDYGYGYSPQGERVYALKSGRRSGRVNMIAGLCSKQLLAPFTIEGSCNRAVFETWLETGLIPVLKPGQKLVIDNATVHHGGRIKEHWSKQRAVRFGTCRLIRRT